MNATIFFLHTRENPINVSLFSLCFFYDFSIHENKSDKRGKIIHTKEEEKSAIKYKIIY